jgi:hypothetical protein
MVYQIPPPQKQNRIGILKISPPTYGSVPANGLWKISQSCSWRNVFHHCNNFHFYITWKQTAVGLLDVTEKVCQKTLSQTAVSYIEGESRHLCVFYGKARGTYSFPLASSISFLDE